MARPTTVDEAIEQAALGPASMTVDGTTVVAQDALKLLEVQKRQGANAQAGSAAKCIFNKISPPGAA